MLVGIYHILACNKADQQDPRMDYMVFICFQVSYFLQYVANLVINNFIKGNILILMQQNCYSGS
jgi:hypothetical protein